MTDHSKKNYYEVYEVDGSFWWKVYHYDKDGSFEIVFKKSGKAFDTRESAEDDCVDWLDFSNTDADLS